jgi:hypothetical protein
MANITISNLYPAETEFAKLPDLELKKVVGGGYWIKEYYDENGDGYKDRVRSKYSRKHKFIKKKIKYGYGKWG